MKVEQGSKPSAPPFEPITITLETLEEARLFKAIFNWASKQAEVAANSGGDRDRRLSPGERRKLEGLLSSMWYSQPFQRLPNRWYEGDIEDGRIEV